MAVLWCRLDHAVVLAPFRRGRGVKVAPSLLAQREQVGAAVRPDGRAVDNNRGESAAAFAAAGFLKDRASAWDCIPGYMALWAKGWATWACSPGYMGL